MDTSPSSKISTLAVIIYNIELIILIFANVSCLLFLSVLKKTKCFHVNLRLLLANFSMTFVLVIISRYLIIAPLWLAYFFDIDVAGITYCRFAKTLHDTAIYVSGLGLAVLVIERTLATALVANYEKSRHRLVGGTLLLLQVGQWGFGLVFVLANQIDLVAVQDPTKLACQKEYTSSGALSVSLFTIVVMDIVAMIVFMILVRINETHYRKGNTLMEHPKLSERYQTAENIRATRLLYPLVIGYLLASMLAGGIMIYGLLNHKKLYQGKLAKEIFQSFDVVTASYAAVFPFLAMYGHTSLFNTMRAMLCRPNRVETRVPLSMDGRNLRVPAGREADIHFQSLDAIWNQAAAKK